MLEVSLGSQAGSVSPGGGSLTERAPNFLSRMGSSVSASPTLFSREEGKGSLSSLVPLCGQHAVPPNWVHSPGSR